VTVELLAKRLDLSGLFLQAGSEFAEHRVGGRAEGRIGTPADSRTAQHDDHCRH
jgi:hypothetical protein